jgi:plasmid stability protein
MHELVLTDVDDAVLYGLRVRATQHGRTPAEEAKAILA